MTKWLLMLSAVVSLSLTGCNDPKLSQIAEKLAQEFEMPVELQSTDEDGCLTEQMRDLYKEYEKLDQLDKDRFKDQMRGKYDRITLSKTELAQQISGTIHYLTYVRYRCDPNRNPRYPRRPPRRPRRPRSANCYWQRYGQKTIGDHRAVRGADPKTQVNRSAALEINTQFAKDESRVSSYWTDHSGYFRSIRKVDDPMFREALSIRRLWLDSSWTKNKNFCGKKVQLNDLI